MDPDLSRFPCSSVLKIRGTAPFYRWWILVVGALSFGPVSNLFAQGRFNAKNSSQAPILSQDGSRLSKEIGRVEILYNGVALKAPKNTFAADGIFSLGVLTIPDVGAGGSAEVTVEVWDFRQGTTFLDALASGYGFGAAKVVVTGLAGNSTPPPALGAFKPFSIYPPLIITQAYVAVEENGVGPVSWLLCDVGCCGRECESLFGVLASTLVRSRVGYFSGRDCSIMFHAYPNRYGSDYFLFPLCYDDGVNSGVTTQGGGIDIRPAPERSGPALVAVSSQGKIAPKLRGLAARRYRIERSMDLAAWQASGEVVGNYSEVDLSPFLAQDDRAQFFRAIDITNP